jgi:uncharacterized membrane protein
MHAYLQRLWRHIRLRPRLASSVAIGLAVALLFPATYRATTRALMTWDIGAGLYLLLAWTMMLRSTAEHMRWRARLQDDGAAAVLLITVGAAAASLVAIILELATLKQLPPDRQALHLGLAAITFVVSWTLVHTAFALHYAHAYYASLGQQHQPPLKFDPPDSPVYLDFAYFSMVIGMTSQTADVNLGSTRMRRLAMAHGLVAFVFNTTLLALSINVAASLMG